MVSLPKKALVPSLVAERGMMWKTEGTGVGTWGRAEGWLVHNASRNCPAIILRLSRGRKRRREPGCEPSGKGLGRR